MVTVAVGTAITDRPPHRSVRARLRIRLLPWINGGEARSRIEVQNTPSPVLLLAHRPVRVTLVPRSESGSC